MSNFTFDIFEELNKPIDIHTNEEKGTVVAVMNRCKDAPHEIIEQCSQETAYAIIAISPLLDIMDGDNPNIRGKAVCADGDTFDQYTGNDIALARANEARHRRMAKDYDKYIRQLEKAIAQLKPLKEMHEKKAENIREDLINHYGVSPDSRIK